MAAEVLFLNSALLPWALSQELCLLWKSLFLGQKESSRGQVLRVLTVSSINVEKTNGPVLLQGVGRCCLDIQN